MPQKETLPKKMLLDSKVKTAALYLTSGQIPNEENFDFVVEAIETFYEPLECRRFLFDNFYDELLDWAQLNSL
jgi:hypothetical protein